MKIIIRNFGLPAILIAIINLSSCYSFVKVDPNAKKNKTTTTNTSQTKQTAEEITLYAPTAHALSSDVPMISTSVNTATAIAATGPLAAASGILAPVGPPALGGPTVVAITNGVVAPTAPNSVVSQVITPNFSGPTPLDSTSSFTANIVATATFPSTVPAAQQLCSIGSPFTSLACVIGSFAYSSSAFTTGSISSTARAGNGSASDKLASSNSLSVAKFKIKQLTNINAAGDQAVGSASINNRVYFFSFDAAGNFKLFSTNGYDLVQASNTRPGSNDYYGITPFQVGNSYYYGGYVAGGLFAKLFKIDSSGLTQISDNRPGASDTVMTSTFNCGNYAFITMMDAAGFRRLYSTDGTTLRQLSNIHAGADDGFYTSSTDSACLNGRAYMTGYNAANFRKIYSSNGTDLVQFTEINGAGADDVGLIGQSVVYNNRLYFLDVLSDLYSTDGTDFVRVTNLGGSMGTYGYKVCGGRFYFSDSKGTFTEKIYVIDGSTYKQVANINTTGGDGGGSNISFMCFKNEFYFSATITGGTKTKLYKYDGTNPIKIMDIRPASDDSGGGANFYPTVTDNFIFFQAKNTSGTLHMYSYDGSKITQLTSSSVPYCDSTTTTTPFYGRYFFGCQVLGGDDKLYSSNGYDLVKHADINGTGVSDGVGSGNLILANGIRFLTLSVGGVSRNFTICADDTTGC